VSAGEGESVATCCHFMAPFSECEQMRNGKIIFIRILYINAIFEINIVENNIVTNIVIYQA
jgi:hypothetical protein